MCCARSSSTRQSISAPWCRQLPQTLRSTTREGRSGFRFSPGWSPWAIPDWSRLRSITCCKTPGNSPQRPPRHRSSSDERGKERARRTSFGTTEPASTWRTRRSSLAYFRDCTTKASLKAPGLDWPLCNGSLNAITARFGHKVPSALERRSISRCPRRLRDCSLTLAALGSICRARRAPEPSVTSAIKCRLRAPFSGEIGLDSSSRSVISLHVVVAGTIHRGCGPTEFSEHSAVTPRLFRLIKRCIRRTDEASRVGSVQRERRHAERAGDRSQRLIGMAQSQRTDVVANLLGALPRAIEGRVREDDHKLLAAEAARDIAAADAFLHQRCYFTQHHVARIVPEGVVDALEVIEIQHDDRERPGAPRCASERRGQRFVQEPPVEQSGQRVGDRLLAQALLCR